MEADEDIERSAAFDELLREDAGSTDVDIGPVRKQTIRLLHEVFRAAPGLTDSAVDSQLPDRIGRFQIQRMLGRGGFGTVYLADDPLLNRLVALKVIHSHLLLDPAMRGRALREREAMARLHHANIIPVWEASEDQNQLFIVSEYCPGQTLAEWLIDHPGPMPVGAAVEWVKCLADAVAHSHQRGVIHRDLKPGNILLEPLKHAEPDDDRASSLEPRLSDFGLAKILDSPTGSVASMVTQSGLFVGSLEYASPEQVKGEAEAICPTTDVYALGVLLYQLLTGRLPHTGDSQYELARHICEEHARFPNECQGTIPKDLQAITLRAIAIAIEDRYASADALRDDLVRFQNGHPVTARPVSAIEQFIRLARKRPAVTVLATACCLLALLYFYNLVASNRRLSEQSHELEVALERAQEQKRLAEEGQRSLNRLRLRETMKLAFEQWQEQNYIGLYDSLERLSDQVPVTMELAFLRKQLRDVYHRFDLKNEPVDGLVWHPTERNLLTISASGKFRRWQPDQAMALCEHQMAEGAHCLALHPNGVTVAMPESILANVEPIPLVGEPSASRITFWNSKDGSKCGEPIQFHTRTVESLEYSTNGRWLAAGPRYTNVVVTDMESMEPFAITCERRNRQILFSPENDRVAVYASFGKIAIHDLKSRQRVVTCTHEPGGGLSSFYSIAWIPGQNAIVANAESESLHVYSAEDGRRLIQIHAGIDAESMIVSPDGHYVALGDNLGFVKDFDLRTLMSGSPNDSAVTSSMRVLSGKIVDMAFIDGNRIVAADAEGNMVQLSLPTSQPALQLAARIRRIQWHDNQHVWAFENGEAKSHFVQVGSNCLELLSTAPPHRPSDVARTQNAKHIATVSMDGLITIVDAASGKEVSTCQLPQGNASQINEPVSDRLVFSVDGQLLFATGENNKLCAVRVSDGKLRWTAPLTNSGYCVAEDAERGYLYLGGGFEAIKVFDHKSGKLFGDQVAGNGCSTLFLDSTRDRLISGHNDGTVRDRSLTGAESPTIHRVAKNAITTLTLTPDHRTLVVGDELGELRIADEEISLYGTLYRSKLRSPEVASLQWSPDNRRLAALIYSKEEPNSEIVVFESELSQ